MAEDKPKGDPILDLPPTPFFTALKEAFNENEAFLANCTPEEIAEAERELDGEA